MTKRVGVQVKVNQPIPGLEQLEPGRVGLVVQFAELESSGNLSTFSAIEVEGFMRPVVVADQFLDELHPGSIRPATRADHDYLD